MSLGEYHKKRNFSRTPEPKGKITKPSKSNHQLYVIQKHAASHLHYDFRLELNGVLVSWAVPKGPCLDPTVKRLAMHVEDHPLAYGSFEGVIPKGEYGGGTVMLWDQGKWICEEADALTAYHNGHLAFILEGEKLKGKWKLVRIKKEEKSWLLIKVKDEYAKSLKSYDITKALPNSVLTQQSIEEISENYTKIWQKSGAKKRKEPVKKKLKLLADNVDPYPIAVHPELATLVDNPPLGDEWLHEIKFDGYRLIAFKKENETTLITRNQNDWTRKFPALVKAINQLPVDTAVVDGEVVALDKKQQANFQLLQNALQENKQQGLIYYAFDLLYVNQHDITDLPLLERKALLQQILPTNANAIRFSDHVTGSGANILQNACKLGLEGIVSKNKNSPYIQRRSKDWLKIKCNKRQEFVIGGFTQPKGKRGYFGSLLIGTYNDKHELVYNGHVGTGFTEESMETLYQLLIKHKSDVMPFIKRPIPNGKVTWVEPVLVAEVEFTEWTSDNSLRHPSFKGLRMDKPSTMIKKEITKSVNSFELTNPQKILFPEDKITKQNIAEYYAYVHEWMLPYVKNRPLTIVRCPDGYESCFYQKHVNNTTPPAIHGFTIQEKKGEEESLYISNEQGLLALVQLGTLEIHTWGSSIQHVEHPDMIIFDLDPAPGITWKEVVKAAFRIKEQLEQVKLKPYVKTTGGKGLHVVIPIKPEYDWEQVKNFAHVFVDFMVMQYPNEYLSKMTKAKRKGKIFIDYLRNQRGATAIAPYSTRARIHAPIATPIAWEELTNDIRATTFTLETIYSRLDNLKIDPWKKFFKSAKSLQLNKL